MKDSIIRGGDNEEIINIEGLHEASHSRFLHRSGSQGFLGTPLQLIRAAMFKLSHFVRCLALPVKENFRNWLHKRKIEKPCLKMEMVWLSEIGGSAGGFRGAA
jgi:hypothetical protein